MSKLMTVEVGDLVNLEVETISCRTGKVSNWMTGLNKVVSVTDTKIDVQINAPGSLDHCSMWSFKKDGSRFKVVGINGDTSLYSIH
jgi:hypothetical protein